MLLNDNDTKKELLGIFAEDVYKSLRDSSSGKGTKNAGKARNN